MKQILLMMAFAFSSVLSTSQAAEPVKIGMITTLSTPAGYLGEDIRDGFKLAIEQGKGSLGGVPVELVVTDDGVNPNVAKEQVTRMLERDRINIFTGTVFSPVMLAIAPEVLRANAYFISANTAPVSMDGAACSPNYFVASWHNTGQFEAAAAAANAHKPERMLVLVANFNGGHEALEAFKKGYTGKIAEEMVVKLNQTDFAAELSRIRALRPDGIFTFLPGGMGVSFLRQLHQAGIRNVKLYSGMTVDSRVMQIVGNAAIGSVGSTFWNSDFDNPSSRQFVQAFEQQYKRTPTFYAAQGYESARLIAAALKATNGKTAAPAFGPALRNAKFDSVRGSFTFAEDQHPIQDWHQIEVVAGADGKPVMRTVGKLLTAHRPPLASACKMPNDKR